jgi:hypothetical protein
MTTVNTENSRRLRNALEPGAAGVCFAPEVKPYFTSHGGPQFGSALTIDHAAVPHAEEN